MASRKENKPNKSRKSEKARQGQSARGSNSNVRDNRLEINSVNGNKKGVGHACNLASLAEMDEADKLLYRAWAKTYENRNSGKQADK